MNKVKKITLFLGIFILGLLITTNVKAASANLSVNKTSVNVGETVTVSVNVNAAAWEIHISGAVSGSYADTSDNGENTYISKQLSFTPTYEGNYTIKMEGNVSEGSNNTTIPIGSSVTITAKSSSNSENSNTNNSNPTTSTKSNIATLANLGIRPNDFSGFKANTFSYNVEVPNETESIEVYASKGQSGQTISGTGKKSLKEGVNTINIVVTAEDGKTKKTYTINVTRKTKEETEETEETEEPEENSEEEPMEEAFGLSELKVEGFELEPEFQTDIYEYRLELKEDLEKLNITTLATKENSNIEITGNDNLQEGENIITIMVKGENEAETVAYQIIVNKTLEKQEDTSGQEQQEKMKKIIILSVAGGVILIIVIAIIIVKIKKSKESNDSYIPYENLMDDYEDDNEVDEQTIEDVEEDEFYEEKPKKKKHSKGKRFK